MNQKKQNKIVTTFLKTMFFLILSCYISGCVVSSMHLPPLKKLSFKKAKIIKNAYPLGNKNRIRLIEIAKQHIGKPSITFDKKKFRHDCSGVIRGIFHKADLPLGGIIKEKNDNDVKAIYRYIQKYGRIIIKQPKKGDLVFFHNTYDRSRNGLMNDYLTHVGIVEKISNDTVIFVHHLGKAIIRSRLNLKHPRVLIDKKNHQRLNHIMRRAQAGHRAYTAAELFAGFGRL